MHASEFRTGVDHGHPSRSVVLLEGCAHAPEHLPLFLKATPLLQLCEVLRSVSQRNGQPIPQSCKPCVTILFIPTHTAASSPRAPSFFFLRSSGNASVVLASGKGPRFAATVFLPVLAGI